MSIIKLFAFIMLFYNSCAFYHPPPLKGLQINRRLSLPSSAISRRWDVVDVTRIFALRETTQLESPTKVVKASASTSTEATSNIPQHSPVSTSSAETPQRPSIYNIGILLLVPLIWGTYSPLVKSLYSSTESLSTPPPPLLFSLLSYIVSFSTLSLAQQSGNRHQTQESAPMPTTDTSYPTKPKTSVLEWSAGIELGMYLFLGSTIQILGIQGTTATRAAILVQLTTILVPVLDSVLSRRAIDRSIWAACILAFAGIVFISGGDALWSGDGIQLEFLTSALSGNNIQLFDISGDLLVCFSAIFYSLHLVRLGQVAKRVNPVNLGRAKSLTEMFASATALTIAATFFTDASISATTSSSSSSMFSTGIQLQSFFTEFISHPMGQSQIFFLFAIMWNGVFSTALTTWAQTVGQQSVSATTANLVYSSQPMWAAVVSFLLLGDRETSLSFFVGCGLLAIALIIAILNSNNEAKESTL